MKSAFTPGKSLLWLCALAPGLTLLSYLGLVVINWNDESPQAAVTELEGIYAARMVPADTDNAYVYLMGYAAPPAASPIEAGLTRIASEREALQQPWTEELPEGFTDRPQKLSTQISTLLGACVAADAACIEHLQANEQYLPGWLDAERFTLERYRGLLKRTAMYEPLPFDIRSILPPYHRVLQGQRLSLSAVWLLAYQGDATQVQKRLDDDLRFWRMVLANANTLIVKMVATRAIKEHFLWANLALHQLPAKQVQHAIPPSWEQPLSSQERSMLLAFSGELTFVERMLQQMKNGDLDWYNSLELFLEGNSEGLAVATLNHLGRPFLQPQGLANRYAAFLLDLEQSFAVPYKQLPAALVRAKQIEQAQRPTGNSIAQLYNLTGNLMLRQQPDSDFTDYFLRIADLEGIRRSSLLAATLHRQSIAPEAVQNYLDNTELNTPTSGEPFAWDINTGTLTFTGLSENGTTTIQYPARR